MTVLSPLFPLPLSLSSLFSTAVDALWRALPSGEWPRRRGAHCSQGLAPHTLPLLTHKPLLALRPLLLLLLPPLAALWLPIGLLNPSRTSLHFCFNVVARHQQHSTTRPSAAFVSIHLHFVIHLFGLVHGLVRLCVSICIREGRSARSDGFFFLPCPSWCWCQSSCSRPHRCTPPRTVERG